MCIYYWMLPYCRKNNPKYHVSVDQKSYIHYTAQFVTSIINAIACIVLMNYGASIQSVKITTSLICLLRSMSVYWYVRKNYRID